MVMMAPFRTASGILLDLADPDPNAICLRDVAYHLAGLNRWTGASRITVAEHSIEVARRCPSDRAAWGLLHDATEAYLGDVSSSLKRLIGTPYRALEAAWDRSIATRFGVRMADVKQWDDETTDDERTCIWDLDPCRGHRVYPSQADGGYAAFLARAAELGIGARP